MKPNKNSILFDLDGTLMNYNPTWTEKMNHIYPEITFVEQYPMTEFLIKEKSPLAGQLSQDLIHKNRFYVDEQIYPECFKLINELINKQFDVWFVTAPLGGYHRVLSTSEKFAQIQRYFGVQMIQKVIFSSKKYEIEGKYLIDDQPKHPEEEKLANWQAILVEHYYNKEIYCDRRVSLSNMSNDFWTIFQKDSPDIQQTKLIKNNE